MRVLPGPVVEFTDPEALLRLRRVSSWRKELNELLSSRHVHLDPWRAPRLIRRLVRQGLLSRQDLEAPAVLTASMQLLWATDENRQGNKRPCLTNSDRSYLLALLLLAEGLKASFSPPPGLFAKLVTNLDERLRTAAARRATEALEQISPKLKWIPEEELPEPAEEELIAFLQEAIDRQQPIDLLYQASQRSQPEYRHLTPMLLEQRGLRWYLIAYCHIRRANRTFRLDRMKLIDFPPVP